MIGKESINYSLKNMAKRKTRSFLTILSIFVGIATIFIFISFGYGLYNYVNSFASGTSADKITIQPKGIGAPGLDETFSLGESDLRAVKKAQGVYEASPVYFKAAEVENKDVKKFVWIAGYEPETPLLLELSSLEIEIGRELQKGDEGKVVLGYNYLLDDKIFPEKLGLNEKILVQGQEFRIVGFYKSLGNPQDDSQIYVIKEEIPRIYPETKGYSWIIARADISDVTGTVSNIEKSLRNVRNLKEGEEDFFVSSFEDMLKSFTSSLNIVILFIILIALISVVVSAINTANTMITSVLERTREIGVIKAIGAKNSELFKIFLFESGLLGFIAGVIGVIVGWSISSAAGKLLESLGWGFLQPYYSWELFLGCILFATVTGGLSGVIPAINASKTNVVEALRYE